MAVQGTRDNTNKPFIVGKSGIAKTGTLTQDEARATDLAIYTLMAQTTATKKWVPFTNAAATDGTQNPRGIVMQTVPAASLVAGDVEDIPILIGDAIIDSDQLVIENDLTLDTSITVPTNRGTRVEDALIERGIFCTDSIDITELA